MHYIKIVAPYQIQYLQTCYKLVAFYRNMEGGLYQGVKNTAELKACAIDTIPGGGTYHLENVEGTSKQWKATLFNNIDSFRGGRICSKIY